MYKIIKIGAEAIFEFIYEKFIENQTVYFDVDDLKVADIFHLDWEKREFTFCTYDSEDADGNFVSFPKDIDFEKLAKRMPITTKSMFGGDRYVSFESLRQFIEDDTEQKEIRKGVNLDK